MDQRMYSALVLLCTRMLFVSCFGRQVNQRQEDVSVGDIKMPILNLSGCSYSRPSTNCQEFELQCNGSRRIQILGSKYGEIPKKLEEASHTTSNEAQRSAANIVNPNLRCPYCNGSWSDTPYNSNHRYDLSKRCSWKATCQPPAVGTYIAHSISYRCVPEHSKVSFCKQTSMSGQLIHILFDGSAFRKQSATPEKDLIKPYTTQCICDINSTSSFRLSVPDMRLLDAKGNCLQSTRISGLAGAETTCSSEQMTIDAKAIMLKKKSLKLSFDVAPEFIWILVQAEETNGRLPKLSVECHPHTNPVRTTSHETDSTKSSTSSTTSYTTTTTSTSTEGKINTTTNEQTPSTTHTTENQLTSTSNNPGQGQHNKEFQTDNDDGVPLPAIIVPIVGIMIAVVVIGIFMCQRRRRQLKRENDGDIHAKVPYQVPATNGQIIIYESATPKRTDENYLELEQEHVYNTLNLEHDDSETIKAKEVSRDQNNEYQTAEPRSKITSGKNEENVYTPLNVESMDKADNIDPNGTVIIQNMPIAQTNEYFTLEPQNTIISGKPVSISERNDKHSVSDTADDLRMGSENNAAGHDYFVLNPQPSTLAVYELEKERSDNPSPPTKDQDGEEIRNYFTLELNDTQPK